MTQNNRIIFVPKQRYQPILSRNLSQNNATKTLRLKTCAKTVLRACPVSKLVPKQRYKEPCLKTCTKTLLQSSFVSKLVPKQSHANQKIFTSSTPVIWCIIVMSCDRVGQTSPIDLCSPWKAAHIAAEAIIDGGVRANRKSATKRNS